MEFEYNFSENFEASNEALHGLMDNLLSPWKSYDPIRFKYAEATAEAVLTSAELLKEGDLELPTLMLGPNVGDFLRIQLLERATMLRTHAIHEIREPLEKTLESKGMNLVLGGDFLV